MKKINIAELSVKEIKEHLRGRISVTQKSARLFDQDDHWQNGDGFLPFAYMTHSEKLKSKLAIEKAFCSENVVTKLISNESNGVLGREPDMNITHEGEATDAMSEIKTLYHTALVKYFADNKILKLIKKANRLGATQNKCIIRAYIPSGLLVDNALPKTKDVSEAMSLLKFEILTADKAGVFIEKSTFAKYGAYLSETSDGKVRAEITYLDENKNTRVKIIEGSSFDELAEKTLPILAKYMPKDSQSVTESSEIDLGGELFYFEFERDVLINSSMNSNQKAVNLNETMKNRNTYRHGNRDIIALNAQQPVEEKIIGGKKEKVPSNVKLGGGQVNFLNGVPVVEVAGESQRVVGYATADFKTIEPSDPAVFITGGESESAAMYRQACQEHLSISESAIVSGKSKKESRDAFEKKLTDVKSSIDPSGSWIMKLLSYFAANVTGQIEQIKMFRFVFDCVVDAGAVDPEETNQDREDVKEGFMSIETYHTRRGIDDSQAENSRLQESQFYQLSLNKKRLEVVKAAMESNIEINSALQLAGFSEEQIGEIVINNIV